MIVNKSKIEFAATDAVLAIFAVLFFIGIRFWFPVCAPMGDSVMSCYWAGEVLKAASWLVLILSFIHIVAPSGKIKTGIDISLIGLAIFTMRIPGGVIAVCQNSSMHCHRTLLWTIVFCVIWTLICLADIIYRYSRSSKDKHSRSRNEETT
ncbi:MAG: DUF4418 family protein [Clostridia bacterium]|nr:DUF4418 family protein [Clostridia bacterium]